MKSIDAFGQCYRVTFDKETKFTNVCGGLFTIISLLVGLTLIYFFGKEMYLRKQPSQISRIETDPNRKNITVSLPMAFVLEFSNGTEYGDFSRIVEFHASYVNSTFNVNTDLTLYFNPFEMKTCEASDFSSLLADGFAYNGLSRAYCLSDNVPYIGGYSTLDHMEFIVVQMYPCTNTTTKTNCLDLSYIIKFLSDNPLQFSIYYQNIDYNPLDFHTPIIPTLGQKAVLITTGISKFVEVHIALFNLVTDSGVIFQDTSNNTYQTIDSFDRDVDLRTDLSDEVLVEMTFYSSESTYYNSRSYIKAQDVIAQMGGMLNIFTLVFSVIIRNIYFRRMNETLIRGLFEINNEDVLNEMNGKQTTSNGEMVKQSPQLFPETSRSTTRPFKKSTNFGNSSSLSEINQKPPIFVPEEKIPQENSQFQKKEYPIIKNNGYFFTLFDNFILSFCTCLANRKLIYLNNYYIKLFEYAQDYTDALFIAKKINEFEKVKMILFNKQQLGIFNMSKKLENPLKNSSSKSSELYKYLKNEEAQIDQVDNYLKNQGMNLTSMDKKLMSLCQI